MMGRRWNTAPATERAWADAAVIVKRREAGETLAAIAADYGIGKSTAKDIANASGYVSPAQRARADVERVRRLYAAGASSTALAAEYGCHNDTIVRMVDTVAGQHNTLSVERAEAIVVARGLSIAEKRRIPVEAFREAYDAADGNLAAAGRALGVSAQTVRNRLGLPRKFGTPSLSLAEMRRRYESGQTVYEVASAAGVAASTVARALKGMGVEMRDSSGAANSKFGAATVLDQHLHAAALLFQAGVPAAMIGRFFDCSDFTVYRRMRLEGIPKPPGPQRPTRAARAVMEDMCRRVRSGELVVEAGRLVPRFVAPLPHPVHVSKGERNS